jgi:UDP-GlcNAc:undecaprenyl-phosphate GlcNAc-1-phosphate transferase
MRTYFAILFLSTVGSFLLTPVARRLAFRWGALDIPSARKIHTEPKARLGGLAVFGGFCLPWIGLYVWQNRVSALYFDFQFAFAVLLAGSTAMLFVGAYDDIKGLSPSQKLAAQVLIAIGAYFGGFKITILSNPFGAPIHLGWLSLPASVLWIVALTNAINLLDGIDGLVTGVTACIALYLALINILAGNVIVGLLTLGLAGACLGFLPYNFSPARMFLGDSGSLLIGFLLACIGITSLFKGTTATLIVVPLILFGLPLFDTTSVILGRLQRRVPLFQADKSHVHHRLLRLGLTQKQAACFLYAVTVLLGGVAAALSVQDAPLSLFIVLAFLIGLTTLTWLAWRTYIRKQVPK